MITLRLVLAFYAFCVAAFLTQNDPVAVNCQGAPAPSLLQRADRLAYGSGQVVRRIGLQLDPKPAMELAAGGWYTMGFLAGQFTNGVLQDEAKPVPAPPVSAADSGLGAGTAAAETKGKKAVWRSLRAAGFSEIHTAGVMGSMQDESGFYAQRVQGPGLRLSDDPASTRNGYGLVQWTPGSKLKDYIGGATPTIDNEVATLKAQLAGKGRHPEGSAGRAFYATRTVEDAARIFHLRYERSASKNSTRRIRNARAILSELSGVAPSAGIVEQGPKEIAAPVDCGSVEGDAAGGSAGTTVGGPLPIPGSDPATPQSWSKLNPRTPDQAVAFLRSRMPSRDIPNFRIEGHCEGYMNRAYGRHGGYYDAKSHWNARGERHTNGVPPKGALVYFATGNSHGHVGMSAGGGRVISTDFDSKTKKYRAGVIGEGTLKQVSAGMGGRVLGWRAPDFVQKGRGR